MMKRKDGPALPDVAIWLDASWINVLEIAKKETAIEEVTDHVVRA